MGLVTAFLIFPGSHAIGTRWPATTTNSFLTNRTQSVTNPAHPQVRQAYAVELLYDDRQHFAFGLWKAVTLSLQLNRTQKIAMAFVGFVKTRVFRVPAGQRAALWWRRSGR
jgi:hypothetical protein